jgi:hypothetical protein
MVRLEALNKLNNSSETLTVIRMIEEKHETMSEMFV